MLNEIIFLFFLTMLPIFELRLAIPVGILDNSVVLPLLGTVSGLGLPVPVVFIVCVIANILIGLIVFLLLDRLVKFFTRFGPINTIYKRIINRTHRKASKIINRYGLIGLILLIGIPLPGTGAWTGALAAYLLGINFKRFAIADIIGVLIAGIIVTAIVLAGTTGFAMLS